MLPESEFENLKQLYSKSDIRAIAAMYRKYRIGPSNISPCCAYTLIMEQTKLGIEKNFKRDVTNQET